MSRFPHTGPDAGGMHLDWSRKYRNIISIKVSSSTMIILSSPRAIKEVVDKRACWASSSRPANYPARLAAGVHHSLFTLPFLL
ncbi:hypothetical protein C8R46DRAFT_1229382 [Mycena filopes]|nr:hypothetical protein C8R46DRAFT_1229382 [Mycena filopes]